MTGEVWESARLKQWAIGLARQVLAEYAEDWPRGELEDYVADRVSDWYEEQGFGVGIYHGDYPPEPTTDEAKQALAQADQIIAALRQEGIPIPRVEADPEDPEMTPFRNYLWSSHLALIRLVMKSIPKARKGPKAWKPRRR